MQNITIDELINLSPEELKKINLHIRSKKDLNEIEIGGIKPEKGKNSPQEVHPKVFFTQGLDGVLQMVNHALKKVYQRKNGNYENNSVEKIEPEVMEEVYENTKKILEENVYYLFDLNECTRYEYELLDDENKKQIDYLSDDFDEEFFEKDENGNRTIQNPEHLVIPSNMHTIKGQGVSKEKVHRIVNIDGSIINAFEIIMKLCKKYRKLNPNRSLPLNKDEAGYNWLEGFYLNYATKSINNLTQESIDGLPDLTILEDIERDQITQERAMIEMRKVQSNSKNIGE